jgi:enediyne polyketide synthase
VTLRDARCLALERWHGLELAAIEPLPEPAAWPAELLAPLLERRCQELAPGHAPVRVALVSGLPESAARERVALELLGAGAVLRQRADGRPEVDHGQVSFSHAPGLCLGVHSSGGVACDLEPCSDRPEATWRDLLGPAGLQLAYALGSASGEPLSAAATRVWTLRECLRKAGGPPAALPTLVAVHAGGWLELALGRRALFSWLAAIEGAARMAFGLVLDPDPPPEA